MAGLVLGAVGAYIAPVGYAALGFSIGSAIGNLLFPPGGKDAYQEGPRLGDLKAQTSVYGTPIPIPYGSTRIAGNVIWAANIVETTHTQTQRNRGKGGGGSTSTQTTYTYSQSFAVGLCEGPITGVRKIWANGKLIYNLSDTADAATIAASNSSAIGYKFYTGSTTQQPSSLIQAHMGDAPGYRDLAYVVFEDMQLADYGNRTPNLEFEIISSGLYAHPKGESFDYSSPATGLTFYCVFDNLNNKIWRVEHSPEGVVTKDVYTGEEAVFPYTLGDTIDAIHYDATNRVVWGLSGFKIYTFDLTTNAPTLFLDMGLTDLTQVIFDDYNNLLWVTSWGSSSLLKIDIVQKKLLQTYFVGSSCHRMAHDPINNCVWVARYYGNAVVKVSATTGAVLLTVAIDLGFSRAVTDIVFDPITESIWASEQIAGKLYKIDINTGSTTVVTLSGVAVECVLYDDKTECVWAVGPGGAIQVDVKTATIVFNSSIIGSFYGGYYSCIDTVTNMIWSPRISGIGITSKMNMYDWGLSSTNPTLSSVVQDICIRGGLTVGDIDVTSLASSNVVGYVVYRGTARGWIEPLMQAFFFDAVESDGTVKFVKRGGASVLTIAEDDLCARSPGSAILDPIKKTRKQEIELPSEVEIKYLDSGAAYLIGSQLSKRAVTSSINILSASLAISMSADKAKQVAEVLMYEAWTSRTTMEYSTGWKYSYLEPTDVITVIRENVPHLVRMTDDDCSRGIFSRQAVLEDQGVYTQTAAGAAMLPPPDSVLLRVQTNLMLLDIPLLRDQDDTIGYYAAAGGFNGGWTGTQVFKSTDNGASWETFGIPMLDESPIGAATTALGDFLSGHIFDESNSVTVVLSSGALSSVSRLNVLNGKNVALLGDEIIQFRTATLVSDNKYTLSGLLRGLQGTEWARSSHVINERFVSLDLSTTYLSIGPSSEYGQERKYRAVTFGAFLADAQNIAFTNNAKALLPYTPVLLGGGRNASLDVILKWVRRSRINNTWNNYSDIPLGETSELYVVKVYTNNTYGTVKRTLTGPISTQTATYSVADQVADFGSAQATVYWTVCQVSATVGNGRETRGQT